MKTPHYHVTGGGIEVRCVLLGSMGSNNKFTDEPSKRSGRIEEKKPTKQLQSYIYLPRRPGAFKARLVSEKNT